MNSFLFNIGLNNPEVGWFLPIIATICAVTLIFWISWWTNSLWLFKKGNFKAKFNFWFSFFITYPAVAIVQYLITFSVWAGLIVVYPNHFWINALVAFCFAIAHVPNWHLLWSSGFIMYFALNHMTIHHNLWPLILMHGMIATCWEKLTPKWVVANSATWIIRPGTYSDEQKYLNKKYDLEKEKVK